MSKCNYSHADYFLTRMTKPDRYVLTAYEDRAKIEEIISAEVGSVESIDDSNFHRVAMRLNRAGFEGIVRR